MGIFESSKDGLTFLYDIILGIRSHKKNRSKKMPIAKFLPNYRWKKNWISLIHKTAVTPNKR